MTIKKTSLVLAALSLGVLQARGERVYVRPLSKKPIEMVLYAVDECGKPLAGEPVKIRMFKEDKLFAKWGPLEGVTDTNGYFRAKGTPGGPFCWCYFHPDDNGYYHTSVEYGTMEMRVGTVVTGVVRKVVNPINMHLASVWTRGSERPAEFGIDVVKGELMPPDGKGSVTDAVLSVSTEMREDADSGSNKPVRAHAKLRMVQSGGGFLVTEAFPSCYFATVREAPLDGKYEPEIESSATFDPNDIKDFFSFDYRKNRCVYKVVRRNTDEGKMESYYGTVPRVSFSPYWSVNNGYDWSFDLSVLSNGRPNDRNLEKYGWQSEEWKKANFDRIDAEPTPEALRYDRDSEGQE